MKGPAISCSRKMIRLLNELSASRNELISVQLAIAIPVRNENEQLESVGLIYSCMKDDNLEFKIGQTKLFSFENNQQAAEKTSPEINIKRDPSVLSIHYPSRNNFSTFVRNLNFYSDPGANQNSVRLK